MSAIQLERRRVRRLNDSREAHLYIENRRYPCRLLDWSRLGARLAVDRQVACGQRVGITGIPGQSRFAGRRLAGRIAWAAPQEVGLVFDDLSEKIKVTLFSPFSLRPRGSATLIELSEQRMALVSNHAFQLGDCPRVVLGPMPGAELLEVIGRVEGCLRQSRQTWLYHLSLGRLPVGKLERLHLYRSML
ncbi:MAG: PilZ domain-containing protein [Vulcanimicrobiota bacterium]